MAFDAFLKQAWTDHADQPGEVALRLRTQTPVPESGEQLSALARLVVHLCGEHLGAFDDGRWRLQALATHPLADAAVQSTLRVGIATLALAQSGQSDCAGFSVEEQVRTQAAAAAICVARHQTARATALLQAARERLVSLREAPAAVHRPLAVACNNMAWELHDRGSARSAEDTAAMLDIAAASRWHWSHAGTWLETERADYCVAMCQLSAGDAEAALRSAARCLAVCTQNDAPPFELLFAHEALARAHGVRGDTAARARNVAAAQAAFEQLPASDQAGCQPTLTALLANP